MMKFLMMSDMEIVFGLLIGAIVFVPFTLAIIYCSIKLIKKPKIKEKILGIIQLVSSLICIVGLLIGIIYETFADRYSFKVVNVLKVDSDKIYVRHDNPGHGYDYYELDKPFYASVKENDNAIVRFDNENPGKPKYYEYYFDSKTGMKVYSVGFFIAFCIGVYYIYIEVKENMIKKEER